MRVASPDPPLHPAPAWVVDGQHARLLAAMVWVLIVLMIVPEGLDYEGIASRGAHASGGAISRALWLGLMLLSVTVLAWRTGLASLLAGRLNPFLAVFVALAVASLAWSIDERLTARRLIRLITIVLVCIAFVLMAWHARRLQNVLRPVLTLMLLGSLLFGLLFPALAIHQESAAELSGAWRGLANHKNGLGALACLTLVFWCHGWFSGELRAPAALAGIALAATCLLLSRSSTSMAAAVFVVAFLFLALRAPRPLQRLLPAAVVLLTAALLLYALAMLGLIPGLGALLSSISTLTGKDASLTGRTGIWWILAEHVELRPLLGSGYAAYWTAGPMPGTESYEFVRRLQGFYPGSAHNGYLEILNDLGWAGLACLFAYLLVHVRQALQLLRLERSQAVLVIALFFQQAITNLSETHWFSVLSVDFVIMALASTALARSLLEHRLRAAFGSPAAGMRGAGP
ncbi:O-antigen ligase [uncultured Piscinibacter sp.]|uniref:O-antigen ligase family protein n=1 Tax=uncultured Piscinibacter sp. TaxID=1131835 RepID=UPI002634C0EA|nr:O-antigen ligase family protein [uncultured Piscinibacter sp.]